MDPIVTLPDLDPAEQRVLGSLLEKEVTVPTSYPMSVNAVITACNQSSSRDPVVAYDETEVHRVLRGLKEQELVAVTWADSGRRTLKYVQTISARLGLADDQRALLTLLLLRGAQAPGALRTRAERLHTFADREAVEMCLAAMAEGERPLVRQLPRRAREQDQRWIHLLGAAAEEAVAVPADTPGETREGVLRDGGAARTARVLATFEAVAPAYADTLAGELDDDSLPFERWLLDRVASDATGPVVEVGCGPGHVTAYLARAGAAAQGLDLSPAMIAQARRLHPQLTFTVGDLHDLIRPPDADGWSAVLGWYSLIYLAPTELGPAVAALVRPIAPGGRLLLALHSGEGIRTASTWFDQPVELEVVQHQPAEVVAAVEAAGLVDVEWYHRGRIASRNENNDRIYVLATKP